MMHFAKTYLGEDGQKESFQNLHPLIVSCVHCNRQARLAIVIVEEGGLGERSSQQKKEYPLLVCDLREISDEVWPHDCCAIAIYICSKCMGVTSYLNQA